MNFQELSIFDWLTLFSIPVLLTTALAIAFQLGYDSASGMGERDSKKTKKE